MAKLIALLLVLSSFTGCATYRSIEATQPGSPKVYSGTRMNIAALRQDDGALQRFHAEAPAYPALDLPFSLVLDTVMFPLTWSRVIFDWITGD